MDFTDSERSRVCICLQYEVISAHLRDCKESHGHLHLFCFILLKSQICCHLSFGVIVQFRWPFKIYLVDFWHLQYMPLLMSLPTYNGLDAETATSIHPADKSNWFWPEIIRWKTGWDGQTCRLLLLVNALHGNDEGNHFWKTAANTP